MKQQQQKNVQNKNADLSIRQKNIRQTTPVSAQNQKHPFLSAQGLIGNHGVLQRCGSDVIQTKLKINKPGDKYEQEADRVAEQVMRMQEQQQSEEEEELQMKAGPTRVENPSLGGREKVSPSLESTIRSMLAGGRALNEQERSFFEPRMGADFSSVRLHSGPEAANMATEIGANAFTVGSHIAVGGGEYSFHSPQGKQLMAHELAHVMQNGGEEAVRRNPLAAMGAAEWIGAAALGFAVMSAAVESSSGDISWKLDSMDGVMLPGGRTDVEKYQQENPNITIKHKELVVSFGRGTEVSEKASGFQFSLAPTTGLIWKKNAGIRFGLAFLTDGKGIGNIRTRIMPGGTYDEVGWGARCEVNLMALSFVGENGKAAISVTLTNCWSNILGNGVDSEIWLIEGDGSFSCKGKDSNMLVDHSLTDL